MVETDISRAAKGFAEDATNIKYRCVKLQNDRDDYGFHYSFFNTVSDLNISHETFPVGETRKQLSKKNWWKLPQKR